MTSSGWRNRDFRRGRLASSRLYVLVDGCETEEQFVNLVRQLVSALEKGALEKGALEKGALEKGALEKMIRGDIIQFREKRMSDRDLLGRAKLLTRLTAGTSTLSIINDRPDIALLSGADGVHIGQDELPAEEVRRLVGPDHLIGLSTHSLAQAREAIEKPVDYIGVGPTFRSRTKHFERIPGIELLREVAGSEVDLPVFAIGGINQENIHHVLEAGIRRVAIQSAISRTGSAFNGNDAGLAAKQFCAILHRSHESPHSTDSPIPPHEHG